MEDGTSVAITMKPVQVVFLEGVHGVGKTTLLEALEKEGYYTIPEGFSIGDVSVEDYVLRAHLGHNFACELEWVGRLFRRLYEAVVKYQIGDLDLKDSLIFVDRSFVTAMVYGKLDDPLAATSYVQLCRMMWNQLEEFGTRMLIVYLHRPDPEAHWQKICERLEREPQRARLGEGERSWMNLCIARYNALHKDVHMLGYELKDNYSGRTKETARQLIRFTRTAFRLLDWARDRE